MNGEQPRIWKRPITYNLKILFWNHLTMNEKNYRKSPLIFGLKDANSVPPEYKTSALLIHQYAMSATSWNHRAKGKRERLGGGGGDGDDWQQEGGQRGDSTYSPPLPKQHWLLWGFPRFTPCPSHNSWLGQWLVCSNGGRTDSRTGVLWEKPASVTLCPPQISNGLVQMCTQPSAVRGWHLTAWAMAWPRKHNSMQQVLENWVPT